MTQDGYPAAVEHGLLMQSFTTAMEQNDEDALRHLLRPVADGSEASEVFQTA